MKKFRGGDLARISDTRTLPKGVGSAVPRVVQAEEQRIIVISDTTVKNKGLNMALSYYLARFYHEVSHHDVGGKRLMCCLIGLLANLSYYHSLRPWQNMVSALKEAGIKLTIDEITMGAALPIFTRDERNLEFLSNWNDDIDYILSRTYLPLILACVVLLSGYKQVNSANYEGWIRNRIKTFSGTVGDTYTPDHITMAQYPKLHPLMPCAQRCPHHSKLKNAYT